MGWLTQYFLNPSYVLPGAALVSLPIIIHLLSRMRYKKVRFAAMEFLLQSDELNRRRLSIEQLLLLLLRVLAVLLIVLLLARLVLDPSQLMMLAGAKTHHVVIIDDTLSMRQQVDEETVFEHSISTLERMLKQGDTFGSQATILLMSQPDRALVTNRALNRSLIDELTPQLRNLNCTWKAGSPVPALQTAYNTLSSDGGVAPQVHVLTDLRASDWLGQPEISDALDQLDTIHARVSIIQVTKQSEPNVAVTSVTSNRYATAINTAWRMEAKFANHHSEKVTGLRASVYVDGIALPGNILIPDIEPNAEIPVTHDITFDTPGQHEVEVRLDSDVLVEDNSRFVVVDVADKRSILIIDEEGSQTDAGFVELALATDQVAAQIRTPDVLQNQSLDDYDMVYLLNVSKLPADAVVLLHDYVTSGGGIAWFPDDGADPTFYNTTLRSAETPLFPVSLGTIQSIPETTSDEEPQFQRPVFSEHPVFGAFFELPFADNILVKQWFGTEGQTAAEDSPDEGDPLKVAILARLTNGDPIVYEHQVGDGRVMTFLTTAGRRWTTWPAVPPAYVMTHMLMHQYLQKPTTVVESRVIGPPLRFEWPVTDYTETVEVFLPASDENADNSFRRLQAAPVDNRTKEEDSDEETGDDTSSPEETSLEVTISEADRPGVYRVRRFTQDGEAQEKWLALSVPETESNLFVAEAGDVEQLTEGDHVQVVSAEAASELSTSDQGRELRWVLIALLIIILLCEQLLALRLSFHPEVKQS